MNELECKLPSSAIVLGTEYTIVYATEKEHPALATYDGFCDFSAKRVVVNSFSGELADDSGLRVENLQAVLNKIVRHELVHAFFYESGLHVCSEYAMQEELVDWLAIQVPKLSKLFAQLEIDG